MKKRLLALALSVALLLPLMALGASFTPVKELSYLYLDADQPYMTLGQPITWQVKLPAEPDPYKFTYALYHHEDVTSNEGFEAVEYTKEAPGQAVFTFTPKEKGKYFLQVEVMDADYRMVKLVSQPFFAYDAADKEDPSTLPGKIKEIVDECLALNLPGDYEKALWLNDWLIYNADYDASMTIHHPDGVLCRGTGVCESYALAYQMLLQEVGMEAIYTTGYSRGESHAWNMVKMDGEWYHVDSTWNDPVGGGNETHDYFGLTDELLKRDHDWTYSNYVFPQATATKYNYNLLNGYLPFYDLEGMDKVLGGQMDAKETLIKYTYHGPDRFFDTNYEVKKWLDQNAHVHFAQSWTYGGSAFSGQMEVTYGSDEGYRSFKNAEEFAAVMEELLGAKETAVKINYTGDDQYFDFRRQLEDWLPQNYRRFDVSQYQYNYTQYAGEITLTYGDYADFRRVNDDDEVAAALQEMADNKVTPVKLFYTGPDPWYNLSTKVSIWMGDHRDLYNSYNGSASSFEVNLDVVWK